MNNLSTITRAIVTSSMDLPIFDLLKRFRPKEEPVYTLYMPPPKDDDDDDEEKEKKEKEKKKDEKIEKSSMEEKIKKQFGNQLIDD
jgi:hypothetical protein